MIQDKTGNIFTSRCQTIVNTVNCVGVMGVGIAFEFRLRYPEMFERYQSLCQKKQFNIGSLWLYRIDETKNVLNFPTKYDWKHPTKLEYLEKGLSKFINTYQQKDIQSIAFPLLGASHGGLTVDASLSLMKRYLERCDIPIEIWRYDKNMLDDLYLKFRNLLESRSVDQIVSESNINRHFLSKLKAALLRDDIRSISGLLTVNGIGEKTLEKAFRYAMEPGLVTQETLFR